MKRPWRRASDIDALASNPTAGDWRATVPSEADDVDWMNKSLKSRAPRITVHDADKPPADEESDESGQAAKAFEIDWGALIKP